MFCYENYSKKLKVALLSKNEKTIRAFLAQYNPEIAMYNKTVFYFAVAKACQKFELLTLEEKEIMYDYYYSKFEKEIEKSEGKE